MLRLAPIFTDHMVLQREKPVRIWGRAESGSDITAHLGDARGYARAENGAWEILLPPMPAGGPHTLEIACGLEEIHLEDVMLGEVWLCGGQSNMELVLQDAEDPAPALDTCRDSSVRLYALCKQGFFDKHFYEQEAASCWQLPEPGTCRHWTAVGYFFARDLAQRLGVTVGLISCNYGGTSASAWISRDYLEKSEAGRLYLQDYDSAMEGLSEEEANAAYDAYLAYHSAWQEKVAACYEKDPHTPWERVLEICGENRYPGPPAPKNPLRPHGLYDTMVARIIPYTLRGVLYYQGESDDHRPEHYETLLRTLIAQWRTDFRDDALPFLLVQLPMFGYDDTWQGTSWCGIREAQERVYRTMRHTGLAVIPDCGEMGNIHPKEKREPARRLVLQALTQVYGMAAEHAFSPMYRFCLPEEKGLRVYFDHGEDGIVLRGEGGFAVCGSDGVWHPAKAQPRGDSILLSSEDVPHPLAARYLWQNYMEPTAFTAAGMPVAPFRTDRRL